MPIETSPHHSTPFALRMESIHPNPAFEQDAAKARRLLTLRYLIFYVELSFA